MGKLGDILERVYGSTRQFQTVRAVIRQWRDGDLADGACGGNRRMIGRRKVTHSDDPARGRNIEEATLSAWLSHPSRARIEKHRKRGNQYRPSLTVVDGDRWWNRDHQGHVETNEGGGQSAHHLIDVERHFDNVMLRRFFAELVLESLGPVRTADRECVRLRAVLRPAGSIWPHWLPKGADEYEFHADAERGVLLSIIARYRDQVFEVDEVTEVAFDEAIDNAVFTYKPGIGEQIIPAVPVAEHLTLQAAIGRVPFTVFIPARVPDPEHTALQVHYHPPRIHSPRAHLTLTYSKTYSNRETGETFWLNQSRAADPELEMFEWERLEHRGQEFGISDPGAGLGTRVLALEKQGTHITIWSDMDRDRLLELATSLVPAPSG